LTISGLDHRQLYRLPWSLTDNVIAWLEPTKQCNISCDGCYSANVNGSHKSLDQIRADLDLFQRFRKTDAVSIAGGDPLTHPELAEVVALVAERGLKPVVNTNGYALTPALLRELAAAGLVGITFHVDSLQKRPGWIGRTEVELNELRQQFADLVAEVGGISCAFNATVYEKTLPLVPEIVAWAQRNPAKVQVVVFIAFRTEDTRFDYYAGGERIETRKLVYHGGRPERIDISSREIAGTIQARFPGYRPAAYLNGTERPDSLKWLLSLVVNDGEDLLGSVGPKFVELAQVAHHLRNGRYLGYVAPKVVARAKAMLPLAVVDPGLRAAARRWGAKLLRRPWRVLRPLHLQSIMIIQPIDMTADGRASMCDGCPDMTVHQGELVWSCRLEEQLAFRTTLRAVPRRRDMNETVGG
jgi:hypothetical protein